MKRSFFLRSTRGQSVVEFALLFAVIVGALLAMQVYMKRATIGNLKGSADEIGKQFDPFATAATYNTGSAVRTREVQNFSGRTDSTIIPDDSVSAVLYDGTTVNAGAGASSVRNSIEGVAAFDQDDRIFGETSDPTGGTIGVVQGQ